MKKFYLKKGGPEEALAIQLQRRHTVIEGDKDGATGDKALRPVSRSSSTSSIYRAPSTAKDLNLGSSTAETSLSANSTASTLVINECQLSSSWLYNSKKAQMCPNEIESSGESTSQQAPVEEEIKSPIIHRPRKVISPSPSRQSKKCSCCCYIITALVVTLVSLGILGAIGGILYMDYFTSSNKTDNKSVGKHQDISQVRKFGLPTNEFETEMPKKEHFKTLKPSSTPQNFFEININDLPDSDRDKTKQLINSEAELDFPDAKESKNSFNLRVGLPTLDETKLEAGKEQNSQKDSNEKQSFQLKDIFSLDTTGDSPYSKLFELYKGLQTSVSMGSSSDESTSTDIHTKDTDFNKDSTKSADVNADDKLDLSESLSSDSNMEHDLENGNHLRLLDFDFDDNIFKEDSLEPEADHLQESSSLSANTFEAGIPKYFFQLPMNSASRKNFDGIDAGNEANSDESFPRFLPKIPQLSDLVEVSDESVSSNQNFENQQEPDLPIELNQPVVGTNIAVPGPIDLIRKLNEGSELANKDSQRDSEVEQQDRRFSLAHALERLRSLDFQNILPLSRKTSETEKKAHKKVTQKVQNEQEVVTERSNYLKNLRRHLFDQLSG